MPAESQDKPDEQDGWENAIDVEDGTTDNNNAAADENEYLQKQPESEEDADEKRPVQEQPETKKGMAADESKPVNEPPESKDDSKSTLYFIVAVAVLLAIGAAIFFMSKNPSENPDYRKVTYNGFEFELHPDVGLWSTQWQRDGQVYNLRLHYNPFQVENVSISGDEGWNAGTQTYLTFDPEGKELRYIALASTELALSLQNTFGITPIAACTVNATGTECVSRPIVNCTSMPENSSVIYVKGSGPAKVILEGNCATMQGDGIEVVRAAEKAIYQWYGIIS